ncbi:hypothetical protein [Microbacterium sp. NPDC087592]|uniref:hypothetical protein n=1 Tax=Microbacterium sp. NPDC087592 TaxID=3364193 RepID=UPI0037FE1AE6
MLALMAAIVPIVASAYVSGSFLVDYMRQNHAARVFERVTAWESSRRGALYEMNVSDERRTRLGHELTARKRLLLELNGVDPDLGTRTFFSRMADPTPASGIEQRRQWILLLSSAAGVVLLGLDAAS